MKTLLLLISLAVCLTSKAQADSTIKLTIVNNWEDSLRVAQRIHNIFSSQTPLNVDSVDASFEALCFYIKLLDRFPISNDSAKIGRAMVQKHYFKRSEDVLTNYY